MYMYVGVKVSIGKRGKWKYRGTISPWCALVPALMSQLPPVALWVIEPQHFQHDRTGGVNGMHWQSVCAKTTYVLCFFDESVGFLPVFDQLTVRNVVQPAHATHTHTHTHSSQTQNIWVERTTTKEEEAKQSTKPQITHNDVLQYSPCDFQVLVAHPLYIAHTHTQYKPDVEVLEDLGIKVVNLSRHVQDVSNPGEHIIIIVAYVHTVLQIHVIYLCSCLRLTQRLRAHWG